MSQPSSTAFAEPPIGPDGLLDITAIARRVADEPVAHRAPLNLAALDAATPAAPAGPFIQTAAQPEQASDHQLLLNEVAAEQPTKPGLLPEGAVEVDLRDRTGKTVVGTFVVLGGDDWPTRVTSWMRDPEKWYEWAMAVLATDDDRDLWAAIDPTNRQTSAFINAYLVATGALPAPKGQR